VLHDVWFLLIAVLWIGYFVLEGFDFGLGILLPFLGRSDRERRALIGTIGPVWDGNEVWVLVAGGATFAAFPHWYATLFSGFYLALFLILVGLIVRGVSFEYRGKHDSPTWRGRWDWAIFFGSAVPAVLWGVAFANIVAGVPINQNFDYTGTLLTLLNPYALLGGVVTLTLFMTHGAAYISLKTEGDLRRRANAWMVVIGLVAAVAAVVFLAWTQISSSNAGQAAGSTWPASPIVSVIAAVALVGALLANRLEHEGWAFIGTGLTIALAVAALFLSLYPNVMPSSTNAAFNLTVTNASSTELTLQIMTIVAVIFTPLVLLYQGWTYWIFRKRISADRVPDASEPAPAS
jgi:cytochrome bd ubiquinol oxidase subunit II